MAIAKGMPFAVAAVVDGLVFEETSKILSHNSATRFWGALAAIRLNDHDACYILRRFSIDLSVTEIGVFLQTNLHDFLALHPYDYDLLLSELDDIETARRKQGVKDAQATLNCLDRLSRSKLADVQRTKELDSAVLDPSLSVGGRFLRSCLKTTR